MEHGALISKASTPLLGRCAPNTTRPSSCSWSSISANGSSKQIGRRTYDTGRPSRAGGGQRLRGWESPSCRSRALGGVWWWNSHIIVRTCGDGRRRTVRTGHRKRPWTGCYSRWTVPPGWNNTGSPPPPRPPIWGAR